MYTTPTTSRPVTVSRACTNDRFEGRAEARGPVSIFPLSGGGGGQLGAGHHLVNGCRLGPPELTETGWNGSWELWLGKRAILVSERKRRLLHDFSDQKMIPECTIFPYSQEVLFSRKRARSGIQIRPAHS